MAVPIETFLTPNVVNILVTFLIPFLIFFTLLIWAFKMTKIFNGGTSVILALGITTMIYATNPGNVFQFLVTYLLQFGIATSILIFMGAIFISLMLLLRWGIAVTESVSQKLKDIEKKEKKLHNKYYGGGLFAPSTEERMRIAEELKRLQEQKKYLLAKDKKLQP